MDNEREIARLLGRRGGEKTKRTKGVEHFKKISRLGVAARRKKRDQGTQTQLGAAASLVADVPADRD